MRPSQEIESLRRLLDQHRQRTVEHGQKAFTRESPEEAHRQADRLSSLMRAEKALKEVEEALQAFPPLPDAVELTSTAKLNRSIVPDKNKGVPIFIKTSYLQAEGRCLDGKHVVVQAGSLMRGTEAPSLETQYRDLRANLIKTGAVIRKGEHWQFTRDVEFKTTSGAARTILARPAQGPREWKLANGEPLGTLKPKEKK